MAKERLDVLVTNRKLAPSREKAKALIMAGEVFVNGQREDKPGASFPEDCAIEVRAARPFPYVSRGGLKLEKAVREFGLDVQEKYCMDVGASTGGFTDVMLQNGAAHVIAVDVGYGQFDWKLRQDPRVTLLEKTNIRYLEPDVLTERPAFVAVDVSFISLTKVLPPILTLSLEEAEIVCLIKPQFEAGREQVGKKGVVRDPAVHRDVLEKIVSYVSSIGLFPAALTDSPIRGPEGNLEYLLYLQRIPTEENPTPVSGEDIAEIVSMSHNRKH